MKYFFSVLLFCSLCFNQSVAQMPPFHKGIVRYDSGDLKDSLRHQSIDQLIFDSVNHRVYAILQTATKVADSNQYYSFPVMLAFDTNCNIMYQQKDSSGTLNRQYTHLAQYGNHLYWAGWEMDVAIADSTRRYPFIVKTDLQFNQLWRRYVPFHLQQGYVSRLKFFGDTLVLSLLEKNEKHNSVFTELPVRSTILQLDTAATVLSRLLCVADTTKHHVVLDFLRLESGDWMTVGQSSQWANDTFPLPLAYVQRIDTMGNAVWYKVGGSQSGGVWPFINRDPNNPALFRLGGTYYGGQILPNDTFVSSTEVEYIEVNQDGLVSEYGLDHTWNPSLGREQPFSIDDGGLMDGLFSKYGEWVAVGFMSSPHWYLGPFSGLLYKIPQNPSHLFDVWKRRYTEYPEPTPGIQSTSVNNYNTQSFLPFSFWDTLGNKYMAQRNNQALKTVVELPSGHLIMAGYTWTRYTNGQVWGPDFHDGVRRDGWLIKTDQRGCFGFCDTFPVSITNINKEFDLEVYPNPTFSSITVKMPAATHLAHLMLTDVSGKVYLKQSELQASLNSLSIDLSTYPAGIYWLQVTAHDGRQANFKIVKQ
jgi:hypothetical protein